MFSRAVAAVLAILILSGLFPALTSARQPEREGPRVVGEEDKVRRHPIEGGVYSSNGLDFAPDRILVKFRDGITTPDRAATRASVKGSLKKTFGLVPGLEALSLPPGADPISAASELSRQPGVEYATPDFAYKLDASPTDPRIAEQWGLTRIGAPTAWNRATGSKSVIVAILDTGVDLNHQDLKANLVPGWNFVAGNNNPTDDFGHGTHVAGIIGAVGNNALGVSGVNWSVGLMPLKICDAGGSCYLSYEIAALEYAVANGATVANASFGGNYGGWQPEQDAIAAAGRQGLLYVAAAGNNSSNNENDPFYPASYPLSNILVVGASRPNDDLAEFSNFGRTAVDLAAPGVDILSTVPGSYSTMSGTSMAAPFAAGAVALVRGQHPAWTVGQVKKRILGTTQPVSSLVGKVLSCGRLNLAAAAGTAANRPTLCVSRAGTGRGSVTSLPLGIDCGSACGKSFKDGALVTLTATPNADSSFAGWSGTSPCSTATTCTITVSSTTTVTARFRGPSTQNGWMNEPLRPPRSRPATVPTTVGGFFDVALSSDGNIRAKTQYTQPQSCYYDSSDTGGVFLERKTSTGWVAYGKVTAPRVGKDAAARWANCSGFGSITRLSGDGSTLLVGQSMGLLIVNGEFVYRCVAFVFKRKSTGWVLDGKLFPPNIGPAGSPGVDGCLYFGEAGAISHDGTRVAMLAWKPPDVPDGPSRLRTFVYKRGSTGWSMEQDLVPPTCNGCGWVIGTRMLDMSDDGATVLMSSGGGEAFHTFTRTGSTWSVGETVFNSETNRYVWFGQQVAISADGLTATTVAVDYWQWYQDRTGAFAYVFERSNGQWIQRTKLTTGLPTPQANYGTFGCPGIVLAGARIICASYDDVGYNQMQGSLYVFDRPAGGWAAGATPVRIFSADGLASDRLGRAGPNWRPMIASPESGDVIDAVINVDNLLSGGYPNDRIGYEFRR